MLEDTECLITASRAFGSVRIQGRLRAACPWYPLWKQLYNNLKVMTFGHVYVFSTVGAYGADQGENVQWPPPKFGVFPPVFYF